MKAKLGFYKYMTLKEDDLLWGIELLDSGQANIPPGMTYPPFQHPGMYHFNWENGRTLSEYQMVYITSGKGIFESASAGRIPIEAGNIFILFPGEWHRYKPNASAGWVEYWIGVKGKSIDNLVTHHYISKENPVLKIGLNEKIIGIFKEIINAANDQYPGFLQVCGGAVYYLMGLIYAETKRSLFNTSEIEEVITKAKVLFHQNIENNISPEAVAMQLNVGYSWFRRMFKHYTELSPGHYYQQIKMQRAKEVLTLTHKSVKEIAFDLGYESIFHFSKIFKQNTGISPLHFRKAQWGSAESHPVDPISGNQSS